MSEKLFPLRLTLWEELFIVDDFENYPANFMTRIRGRGRLSRELFLMAVENCTQSHPLFLCKVHQKGRGLYWEEVDSKELPVEFESGESEPGIPLMRKFDVCNERLWRIRFAEWQDLDGNQWTDIFVEFHHTLCDGLGAIQFISDVAREIHDLHHQNAEFESTSHRKLLRMANTDLGRLRNRGKFPQTWKEFFRGLPNHYKSVLASLRLAFAKVSPLVPVDSVKSLLDVSKESLGYHKIVFAATDSSKLRRTCRKQNTTVNSKIAAVLFQAILEWKMECGHPPVKALRVIMPFNERSIDDLRLPACNRVSVSPFTRKRKEIEDSEKLLESIEKGVRVVKKGRLGLNFHRGLWFCKTICRSLRAIAQTGRVGATAVFANVGNLDAHLGLPVAEGGVQCGTLIIADLDLVPPARVGTSFAMTMHEFQGETRLGIHYDSTTISSTQAESFFGLLRERILDINTPN